MNNPLQEIRPGQTITAAFLNSIVRQLRAIAPQSSADVLVSVQPGGTTFNLRRKKIQLQSSTTFPFQIYAYSDPNNPQPTDWRTFQVRSGTVNSHHPASDSSFTTPTTIIIPAGSDNWVIWLSAVVNTTDGAIDDTTWTISNGASGWPGYPSQPIAVAGQAPGMLYILLGEVTTGSDTEGDQTYQQVTILQNTYTSLMASRMVVSGTVSPTQGGFYPVFSMMVWRA